jgi:hypothetical protein
MGNWYANAIVRADRQAVVDALKQPALVAPTVDGWTTIFPTDQWQSPEVAAALSGALGTAAGAAGVLGDDVLLLEWFDQGQRVDLYNSHPDASGLPGAAPGRHRPAGGDLRVLSRLGFPRMDTDALSWALRATHDEEPQFLFETDRHLAVVEALGLADWWVGHGYEYLDAGLLPGGLTTKELWPAGGAEPLPPYELDDLDLP